MVLTRWCYMCFSNTSGLVTLVAVVVNNILPIAVYHWDVNIRVTHEVRSAANQANTNVCLFAMNREGWKEYAGNMLDMERVDP